MIGPLFERLRLHPDKTMVVPTAQPQPFLGFELLPDGRRRLKPENVSRFRRRLDGLRRDWQQGEIDAPEVHRRVPSWTAHALHADTVRLRHTLFKGGWFDPQWSDGQPVKAPAP